MKKLLFILAIVMYGSILEAEEFWEQTSFPFITDSVQSIKVDRNNFIYVATRRHGIVRSTNQGLSWEEKNTGLDTIRCWNICVDSLNNLYVSAFPIGIYKSTDRAEHWEKINNGIVGSNGLIRAYNIEATNNNILFAWVREDQIYKSTDYGVNWIEVTSKSSLSKLYPDGIAIGKNNFIFAMPSDFKGLYRSTDLGLSWTQIYDSSNIRVLSKGFNSYGNFFVYIYNIGLMRSRNNGESFELIDNIENPKDFKNIYINKSDHIYLGDYKKGLYVSYDDATSWNNIDTSKINKDLNGHCSDANGYLYAGTFGKGLYRSKFPMKKLFLGYNIMPRYNDTAKFDYGDTVTYSISIVDKSNGRPVINANIQIKNDVLNNNETFTTDTLGILNYSFIIPQGQDTGTYKLQLYVEKFGYEKHDTIEKTIHIVHSDVWVNQISKSRNIEILPNPANDKIQIRIPDYESGTTEIWLTTLTGSRWVLYVGTNGEGTDILTFDLSSFSSGTYFINVQTKNQIHSEPLILLK